MLTACLPWLAVLVVSYLLACFLVRVSRARLQLGRLKQLHRDQQGGVQSLSFVLTLPIFIMVMMLIVQVSQLMIGIVVVHYAAFAAARSAIVWIPASLEVPEASNCLSYYFPDPAATDQVFPILDPADPNYGPRDGGVTYLLAKGGPKYNKIKLAAILATMPISPSRDYGFKLEEEWMNTSDSIKSAFASMAPSLNLNSAVPKRIDAKLAYALNNTDVEVRFNHKNTEPPLKWDVNGYWWGIYEIPPEPYEFKVNEVGWQDLVTVKVTHNFALLPGPGRMLARYGLFGETARSDAESRREGKVSVYKDTYGVLLTASAALNVEGEKSVIPYVY
jgi:hypothetical protein